MTLWGPRASSKQSLEVHKRTNDFSVRACPCRYPCCPCARKHEKHDRARMLGRCSTPALNSGARDRFDVRGTDATESVSQGHPHALCQRRANSARSSSSPASSYSAHPFASYARRAECHQPLTAPRSRASAQRPIRRVISTGRRNQERVPMPLVAQRDA